MDVHVQRAELRKAAQRQDVGRPRLEHLGVRDHDLLLPACWDREDTRREFVARTLLEQSRILPAMKEVFVCLARALLLDDLALLPRGADLHREAAERRPLRQRDAERSLELAVFGVLED